MEEDNTLLLTRSMEEYWELLQQLQQLEELLLFSFLLEEEETFL